MRSRRTRSLVQHGHGRARRSRRSRCWRAPACLRRADGNTRPRPSAGASCRWPPRGPGRTCRRYPRSEAIRDRRPDPAGAHRAPAATRTCARDSVTLYKRSGNWVISYLSGRRQARRRHVDGAHRRGGRGLAGDPGRLGDGPRTRAATSATRSRAGTSGCRCACCSWRRSSTRAGRSACCTSTCSCWSAASASRTSSSTRARSGRRCRSSTRCSPIFLARMLIAGFRPRRPAGAAGAARAGRLAGGRDRPARRAPDRARPHRAARSATSATAARSAPRGSSTTSRCTRTAARTTSTSTPTGRSTTSPTTRSCGICKPSQKEIQAPDDYELPAARAAALVFDLLTIARAVPARPAPAARPRRTPARPGARLRLGELPLHAVPADEQRQRHADRDAARLCAAGVSRRHPRAARWSRSPAPPSSRRSRWRRCSRPGAARAPGRARGSRSA